MQMSLHQHPESSRDAPCWQAAAWPLASASGTGLGVGAKEEMNFRHLDKVINIVINKHHHHQVINIIIIIISDLEIDLDTKQAQTAEPSSSSSRI